MIIYIYIYTYIYIYIYIHTYVYTHIDNNYILLHITTYQLRCQDLAPMAPLLAGHLRGRSSVYIYIYIYIYINIYMTV